MRIHNSVFLIIVLVLAGLSAWLFSVTEVKYGLDVQGGVRLTYQIDAAKLTPEQKQNIEVVKARLVKILTNRVGSALGVVEGNVQRKGVDQFVIELPGEKDVEKASQILSTTASIKFYHARTVTSDRFPSRRFEYDGTPVQFKGIQVYQFRERTSGSVIAPGTADYKAMIKSWGEPIIQGADLANARGIAHGTGYIPEMNFSSEGSRKMENWSRRYPQENLAAVLDDQVLSIAPLKEGAILRESAIIEGTFEKDFVLQLTELLNAGALPVDLIPIATEKVDPTIGKAALSQIMQAGYIAFVVIGLFVLIYYMFPGAVALTALLLYALFSLTVLKLIGATFSLAAIAGLILSVGMAVDANILIFERIKEELRSGKTLKSAIDLGFKRALSAIVDSNACTILTSLVLMSIGTGPVKGFASTLIIGVLISLFTAITVTRWIIKFLVGVGIGANEKLYGLTRQWFGERFEAEAVSRPLPIVDKRNRYFLISILSIVIPGAFFLLGGLKPNVEFLGGYEISYNAAAKTKAQVDEAIEKNFKGGNSKVAEANGNRLIYVTIPPSKAFEGKSGQEVRDTITSTLGFAKADEGNFSAVGPTIQKEAIQGAIRGVIFSTLLIVVYLAIRFGIGLGGFKVGLRFSLAAIGALLHDILVVVALAAMFGYLLGWEVSALFITGMLTVVGFSTHDTIVIFDRIRENLHKPLGNEDIKTLINRSITQSIARSINTSSTVIVTLGLLIFIGSATPDLRFFNTIMLCGIVSGTYSSIFNASPILYLIDQFFSKKGEQHSLLGIAKRETMHAHVSTSDVGVGSPVEAAPLEAQAYGQVKRRRASAKQQGSINLDDEP